MKLNYWWIFHTEQNIKFWTKLVKLKWKEKPSSIQQIHGKLMERHALHVVEYTIFDCYFHCWCYWWYISFSVVHFVYHKWMFIIVSVGEKVCMISMSTCYYKLNRDQQQYGKRKYKINAALEPTKFFYTYIVKMVNGIKPPKRRIYQTRRR